MSKAAVLFLPPTLLHRWADPTKNIFVAFIQQCAVSIILRI